MEGPLPRLLAFLDLKRIDDDAFEGLNSGEPRPRVFGGHVAAQALIAAGRTVHEHLPHSLHAYFLRPGDPESSLRYDVERIRDGRSFTTRRVVARQSGEAIFSMSVSFHRPETGHSHQIEMPAVKPPEQCPGWIEYMKPWVQNWPERERAYALRHRPIEMRPVDPVSADDPERRTNVTRVWFRADGTLPDDPMIHRAVACYGSDFGLLSSAMRPHGRNFSSRDIMAASLDHAMWFHRSFRFDQWHLYDQLSPVSADARGLATGRFFSRDGQLVISVVQEGLIRPIEPRGG